MDIPSDMTLYYSRTYYAFEEDPVSAERFHSLFRKTITFLERSRNAFLLTGRGVMGRALSMVKPHSPTFVLSLLRKTRLQPDSNILDVGCGNGRLLHHMKSLGCGNLTGVDPFLPRDIRFQDGFVLLSQSVGDLPNDPPFDLIMFNHSFEHVSDPHASMKAAARLLADEGVVFIRTPTVDSYAWRHYGVDWVQLDAPRHSFIHSRRSLEYLAEAAGLELYDVIYDSTEFQFWGSEQYRRDIALNAENSYAVNPSRSIFTKDDIRSFRRRALELNRTNDGDQAAFYLRKKR